jgi:hypothetical protein
MTSPARDVIDTYCILTRQPRLRRGSNAKKGDERAKEKKEGADCSAGLKCIDDLMVAETRKADAVGETTVRVVELTKPSERSVGHKMRQDPANRLHL